MKVLITAVFIVLALLVAFFGLGPVLMADGSFQERMLTLAVVIAVYVVLALMYWQWHKKNKKL